MTDLELVDCYIETCMHFIDPRTLGKIQSRGLYNIVNFLGGASKEESKAIARARLAQTGRYIGNPDIELMSGLVDRIRGLQKEMSGIKPADADKIKAKAEQILRAADALLNEYN